MNQPMRHTLFSSAEEALKRWWGYDEFRPTQLKIIESVLDGRDTLALMPTGGGKSLTYQVPAMVLDGLAIVVTPLIALMKDQVDRLRSLGISAVAVHSGMDQRRIEAALDNCTYGDTKLLYIAPERLATDAFRVRLKQMNISLIAVDEAHCISQWGYDFRPSYLRISEVREYAPNAPVLALTASATDLVAEDIMHHLGFSEKHILRASFSRPNLSYVVRQTEDKFEQLLRVVQSVEGSGIIYASTREGTEQIATRLKAEGINAEFYHAGLPNMERSIRQTEWHSGKVRIMVATNAFGMGIDKADVRFVIHYTMCDSLEAYYQEAGRAGRDGRRSYAVLLVTPEDAPRIERRFENEFPPIEEIKHIYERIANYLQVAIGDGEGASFLFNIYEFCHRERIFRGRVESALKLLDINGYMTLIEEHDKPAQLIFNCSRDSLYKVNVGGNDMDKMLRTILRLYDGVFSRFRTIDELMIATHSELSAERVHELLKVLWRMNVIRYIPAARSPMILFQTERLPLKDLYISPDSYGHRQRLMRERFENMLRYAMAEDECRSRIIERYFGDKEAKECGVCDNCLRRKRLRKSENADDSRVVADVLALIREECCTVKDIVARVKGEPRRIVEIVDKLLREGKISLDKGDKLRIIS